MLISETEIQQLFLRAEGDENITILLGAKDTIITSNQPMLQGMRIAEFEKVRHMLYVETLDLHHLS